MSSLPPKSLQNQLTERLTIIYGAREANQMAILLLDHFCGIDRIKLALNANVEIDSLKSVELEKALNQLLDHVPIQHIIGEVEFYDCLIKTDARALIPRPETEELVDWIVAENNLEAPKITDIGTGTGCIPIALKKAIPSAIVTAIDVSEDALALARENAAINKTHINFIHLDILTRSFPLEGLDLIVSNPPYIPEQEKAIMDKNVIDYEPGLALFVPNNHPLLFYSSIGEMAIKHLTLGGLLYFEIHENYGKMLVTLMKDIGFTNVRLKKDLQGKDRMIQAQKIR
jgi:release factor glutamine methyltransferase